LPNAAEYQVASAVLKREKVNEMVQLVRPIRDKSFIQSAPDKGVLFEIEEILFQN